MTFHVVDSFDDPRLNPDLWEQLLARGETDTIDLTWHVHRAWWECFGHGRLLLVAAEQDGCITAVAPLFTDEGIIYNVCPKDCLDFIGDVSSPEVLEGLLRTARDATSDFAGFYFYFLPHISKTVERLQRSTEALGLTAERVETIPSPALSLTEPGAAEEAANRTSLRRHERFFQRDGLNVLHLTDGDEILPHLEEFFEQHIARRAATQHPSPFVDPIERQFYIHFTTGLAKTGWLRFTRLEWHGRAIAFHLGFSYRGRYLFGVPTFAIDLARHSPGEVLLRQLFLQAASEGARVFDFGLGDEPYKYRFATETTNLENWTFNPTDRSSSPA